MIPSLRAEWVERRATGAVVSVKPVTQRAEWAPQIELKG